MGAGVITCLMMRRVKPNLWQSGGIMLPFGTVATGGGAANMLHSMVFGMPLEFRRKKSVVAV